MDIRINKMHSSVQVGSTHTQLDPQVMRTIVRACVKAVKQEQEREKRREKEGSLNPGSLS